VCDTRAKFWNDVQSQVEVETEKLAYTQGFEEIP